jgi:Tfp pilus assembly protein PilF
VKEAQRALNRGDAAHARDLALDAVRRDATNVDGWLTLGAAHEALGQRGAAKQVYESCVQNGHGKRVAECRALLAR